MFSIGLNNLKDKIFWCFILFLSFFKLIICNSFPLSCDELHFCVYSKFLSLSYFDHPPLIAYLIKIFSLIFGNTNMMPRICSSCIFVLATYILYCFIKKASKSTTISQITIILIYSTPMLNMLECATDIPFMLFFYLSIYLFYYFIETKNNKYLFLSSLSIGLGLLSKYTMLCIYPSIFLFLLISKPNRYLLKDKKLYLSFIISLLFLIPVIIWNIKFDNISFFSYKLDFFSRLSATGTITNIDLFFQFLGSQFIYYNPFLSFIHRKILYDIIFEYIPFLKIYGIINLLLIIWIYYHLLCLYFKTKKNIFIFVFSFSIVILSASILWSFYSFPIEYCAKLSFSLLCFYIAYIFNKKIWLYIIVILYCTFGIYLSLINPIYFLYGINDLKIKTEKYEIKKNLTFKEMIFTIEKYKEKVNFIVCTDSNQLNNLSYYLNNDMDKKLDFIYLFSEDLMYSYWKQNLQLLRGKNCILFVKDNTNLIEEVKNKEIFSYIEEIFKDTYICKNFNYEKYKEHYSKCHYELQD